MTEQTTPVQQFASVINLNTVNKTCGEYITTMAAEFITGELNVLLDTGEDGNYDLDTLGWLYDNIDYSQEVTDPFSLDDLYTTTASQLSIAVFEIRNMYEYSALKDYLIHNMAIIETAEIEPRENTIITHIDLIKE